MRQQNDVMVTNMRGDVKLTEYWEMESLEVSEGQSSNIHSSDVETTLWFFRPSILQLQNRDFSRLERKVNITEQHN